MSRTETVDVEGTRLHARLDGEAGPWLVFGNSLVTDLSIWDAQAEALSGRHRVLRYDQRGHGQSGVGADKLDFEVLGRDLLKVLDHFGVGTCVYVGLSMGVPTGLAACAMQSGRFDALVAVDGMARTVPTGAATWGERIATAKDEGMERIAEDTVARWLQPDAAGGALGRRLHEMVAATPLEGYVKCAGALQGYDHTEVLTRLRCPLVAIAGACDGAMPDTMERVFGPVAAAPLVRIPDAGHVPNFEKPDAFNAALADCLGRIG